MNTGRISIGRPNYSHDKEVITIQIEDFESSARFIDVEISLADFAKALTGLSGVKCEYETRALDVIGKTRENKRGSFTMPEHDFSNRKEVARKCAEDMMRDGWLVSDSFNSQDTFSGHVCNFNMCRFI